MPSSLQRKYVDLIHEASSKWINWDPSINVRVGAYGTVDKETGELIFEGNIYDPAFQAELDEHGVNLKMSEYPPQEGPVEDDFSTCSPGTIRGEVDKGINVTGIENATFKGKWLFERGKPGALLVMHGPRQIFLPPDVFHKSLFKVDKLIDKWLVTSIHVCPAYAMYLSENKWDNDISLALVPRTPITTAGVEAAPSSGGFTWWSDAAGGVFRSACDQSGNFLFTPLYALKSPSKRSWRIFRDTVSI